MRRDEKPILEGEATFDDPHAPVGLDELTSLTWVHWALGASALLNVIAAAALVACHFGLLS